jgi:hypothetical protein
MLGRLEMNIDDCIAAYTSLSDRIFTKKRYRIKIDGKVQGRFDTAELERAIKDVIRRQGLLEDELLKQPDAGRCKAYEFPLVKISKLKMPP